MCTIVQHSRRCSMKLTRDARRKKISRQEDYVKMNEHEIFSSKKKKYRFFSPLRSRIRNDQSAFEQISKHTSVDDNDPPILIVLTLVLFISNKGSSISLHLSIIVILRIDSTLIFFFFSEWSSLQYCVMEIFFSSSTNNKHCTYRWNNKREILLGDISFDWTLLDCCCLIIKKKEKKISQKWVQRIRRH